MAYLLSNLLPRKGSHPVSTTTIHLPSPSTPYESCSLHVYYALPPLLFVDTHELAQRSASYTFRHWGTKDIEKPVHALPDEISELLINVPAGTTTTMVNNAEEGGKDVHVEVPMHLRYGAPKSSSGTLDDDGETRSYEQLRVDWPKGFMLCPYSSNVRWSKQALTLPAHVLAALPGSQDGNIIVAIPPQADAFEAYDTLTLPVGNTKDIAFVESLTALTILACFIWLVKASWRTAKRLNTDSQRLKTA
ncbi:hypothetical protein CPC08DRAFT_357066 [Agrocybe pediades]|nr:hypothetical protein CPC08DRAFT_357066 [Agrocybe pediades]